MYAIFAALGHAGAETEFVRQGYRFASDGLASGEPQLLLGAMLCLVWVPSELQALSQLVQCARRYRAWRDLTAAAPQVVLSLEWTDQWGTSPAERLERMRIEVGDAAEIVARFARPLPTGADEIIESTGQDDREQLRKVAVLVIAAQRLSKSGRQSVGEPVVPVADLPDVETVLRLWEPAKSVVSALEGRVRPAATT